MNCVQPDKGKKLSILVIAAFFYPGFRGGGPIKTLKNIFRCTGDEFDFKLITGDRDLGDSAAYSSVNCGEWNELDNVSVYYANKGWFGFYQIVRQLVLDNSDVVYLNSFFSPRFSFIPILLCRCFKRKVVLAPRGEFSEGALSIKPRRKKFFIYLYKTFGLHKAAAFQASSCFEEKDIYNALGEKVSVLVAENIGDQFYAESFAKRVSNKLKMVFVSRISPKKNLLAALHILKKVERPIRYDIYGPIEDLGYWQQCQDVIDTLPKYLEVNYMGEINPEYVVDELSKYDAFFFPTKGENYGHVIAEALCAALPVIISDATPWRGLESQGVGWDISLSNTDRFASIITSLCDMSPERHYAMRQNVLQYSKEKFSQKNAVKDNVYMFKYASES